MLALEQRADPSVSISAEWRSGKLFTHPPTTIVAVLFATLSFN